MFKGRVVIALPLVALIISSAAFLGAVRSIAAANEAVDHAERVQDSMSDILTSLVDAETGVRGYLLTRNATFLEPYHGALSSLPADRATLDTLVGGDAELAEPVGALSSTIDHRLGILTEALGSTPNNRVAVLDAGKAAMDLIRREIASMAALVNARLAAAKADAHDAVTTAALLAIASLLLGLLAGLGGIRTFVGGIARGVQINTENAERLARGEPLSEAFEGADEIGRSGRALVAASERLAERDRAVCETNELLRLILQRISEGVVVADVEGRFVVFNEAAEEVLGLGALERDPSEWASVYGILMPNGAPFPSEELPLSRAIRGESVDAVDLVVRNPHKTKNLLISITGRPLLDDEGHSRGGVVVFRDVTDEREQERRLEAYRIELEQLNVELHEMATVDALSGLPNRRGFEQLSAQLLSQAERRDEEISVIYADLDGLKAVNDRLGHDVGSQMIADAAQVIHAVARDSDVSARLGGDEFCILLTGDADVADRVMGRIRERIQAFNAASHRAFELSLSLGAATAAASDGSLDVLMRVADERMYEDKRARKQGRRVLQDH
jgi:diguanylate cyclase (GGDEF)-like protein